MMDFELEDEAEIGFIELQYLQLSDFTLIQDIQFRISNLSYAK